VEVSEVRFRKADLPLETSQAIYERMKSERQREAKELRAQGAEWAQQIQSKADKEKSAILSEAQRTAKISRGQADAQANQILSDAFGRDPQFYRLYRSLSRQHRTKALWLGVLGAFGARLRFMTYGEPAMSISFRPEIIKALGAPRSI
jgi:HflC protein